MTEDFVRKEAKLIRDTDRWPAWPVLPMKNRANGVMTDKGAGMLFCGGSKLEEPVTLYVGNMWNIAGVGDLHSLPQEKYDTVEALVRAGWEGD